MPEYFEQSYDSELRQISNAEIDEYLLAEKDKSFGGSSLISERSLSQNKDKSQSIIGSNRQSMLLQKINEDYSYSLLHVKYANQELFSVDSPPIVQQITIQNNGLLSWPASTRLDLIEEVTRSNIAVQQVIEIGEVPT